MRIAVISDTHAGAPTPWMQAVYQAYLEPADVLVHCGDMTGQALWSFFLQHPCFYAVAGNMCEWELSRELEQRVSFTAAGLTVGVVHGWGQDRTGLSRKVAESFGPGYDLICFGHTHTPEWARHGQAWVVNPGSLRESGSAPTLAYVHVAPDGGLTREAVAVPRVLGGARAAG
jgi:putative phosphoesterase